MDVNSSSLCKCQNLEGIKIPSQGWNYKRSIIRIGNGVFLNPEMKRAIKPWRHWGNLIAFYCVKGWSLSGSHAYDLTLKKCKMLVILKRWAVLRGWEEKGREEWAKQSFRSVGIFCMILWLWILRYILVWPHTMYRTKSDVSDFRRHLKEWKRGYSYWYQPDKHKCRLYLPDSGICLYKFSSEWRLDFRLSQPARFAW